MNWEMIVFESSTDSYRAAFVVRRSPLIRRTALVGVAPTVAGLREKLAYEPVVRRIDKLDDSPEAGDLRRVADEFFEELGLAVAALEARRQETQRKVDYWEARIARYSASERSLAEQGKLEAAQRHYERQRSAAVGLSVQIEDREARWRIPRSA